MTNDRSKTQARRITHPGNVRALLVLLLATLTTAACAQVASFDEAAPAPPGAEQQSSGEYVPKIGQAGKDVIWVPTPQDLVTRMLDLANAMPQDYLVDLGSGDGRTVIAAAKRGLRAHGIEYNPEMVELARRNAAKAGVGERATFEQADIFRSDFSDAQIVSMFLLPSLNERLRPQLLAMKPGTRIVTNAFRIGDWEPDETVHLADCNSAWCTAHLWIVPAHAEGTWRLGDQTLTLKQTYQKLSGTLDDKPIIDARLRGERIVFEVDGVAYAGVVEGSTMRGTSRRSSRGDSATRRTDDGSDGRDGDASSGTAPPWSATRS